MKANFSRSEACDLWEEVAENTSLKGVALLFGLPVEAPIAYGFSEHSRCRIAQFLRMWADTLV